MTAREIWLRTGPALHIDSKHAGRQAWQQQNKTGTCHQPRLKGIFIEQVSMRHAAGGWECLGTSSLLRHARGTSMPPYAFGIELCHAVVHPVMHVSRSWLRCRRAHK